MAVFRVNKLTTKGYTIVMNKMLQDKELSLEAKGLLGLILTLPDDWDYSIGGLVSITNQKYNKVNKTIKELIDKGYIIRTKLNPNETTSGRYEYIYDIYEEKTTVKKQQVVKQPIVKQPIVFDTLNIINNKQNTNIQNNKINNSIFRKPTIEEIQTYCNERNNGIDAEQFYDFYECKGWLVGKNKMKDWKAAVRTWEKRNKPKENIRQSNREFLERKRKEIMEEMNE